MSQKPKRPKARLPRGFVDAAGDDLLARQEMIETIVGVYRSYGFQPLETPSLEYLDALGKFLPDKDAPGEGVFAFRNDDDDWVALRYDLTAPLARFVAENRQHLAMPYRRYQVGPVYRVEKPGPGRLRQFYQCDFDTVGSRSPAVEAEVGALLAETLETLGIARGDYRIKANNRKILNGILARAGVVDGTDGRDIDEVRSHVLRSIDKLDRVGLDGVKALLGTGRTDDSGDRTEGVGLNEGQIGAIVDFVTAGADATDRREVLDRLAKLVGDDADGQAGIDELAAIDDLLTAAGVGSDQVEIDPTIVRGLDYYTGPVFEALLTFSTDSSAKADAPSFGSIGGGGRYDDLIKRFTGQEVPACGASIGVDRLLAALRHLGRVGVERRGPVVVTAMDRDRMADYQAMVTELRRAGIAAELYLGNKNLGHQLKYADRRSSPLAVIAGSDEFDSGTVIIKDLAYGKEVSEGISEREDWLNAADVQQTVARADLVQTIATLLNR